MKPIYFLLFFALFLILGGINRGIDISDEGLYALLAHPLQENQAGIFNYDLFFKSLYQLTSLHFGLVELRFLRLLGYVAAALALAIFLKHISGNKKIQSHDVLLALFGLFAGYAFLPQSLSYNHLTVGLACCWLALISGNLHKNQNTLALGFVLGFLVYVKITTAIILFFISVGVFSWKKVPKLNLGLVLLPFLLLELLFFLGLETSATQRLWYGINLIQAREDYALWTLIKINLVGIYWIGLSFLGSLLASKMISSPSLKLLAWVLWCGILIWFTHITEEWNHVFLLASIPLFVALLTHPKIHFWESKSRYWILLLGILPILLHFGSNVYWLRIGIHYWVFWILGLWILAKELKNFQYEKWMLGLGLITCFLIFMGVWWMPFGQAPLWKNQTPWEYLPEKSIKLNPEQVQKLQELEKHEEIQPSIQILAAYRISGIPFLLGKTMPKSPGFWDQDHLKAYFPDSLPDIPLIYAPSSDFPKPPTNNLILLTEF